MAENEAQAEFKADAYSSVREDLNSVRQRSYSAIFSSSIGRN